MRKMEKSNCRICGKEPMYSNMTSKHGYIVECQECGIRVEDAIDPAIAINRWNTIMRGRECTVESSMYDECCNCWTTYLSCGCTVIDGWSFEAMYCPKCGARVVNAK